MQRIVVLAVLLLASFSSAAQDFQAVPLSDAFLPLKVQNTNGEKLPLLFTVPGIFEKHEAPEQQTALWGTKEDIDAVLATGNLKKSKNGIFTLKISLNVGYDEQSKKFSGEEQMANAKNQPGLSDVTFLRSDVQGFPMATFTAVSGDRHIFLQYIALGRAALLINYFPAETFSSRDLEIWSRFVNGFAVKN